jgi:glycosyltransferase involved in cell wall biosynthesis
MNRAKIKKKYANYKKKFFFVIPAYNEETTISPIVNQIISKGYTALVIDDCSRDGTYKVAKKAGAIVLRHPINLGQGAAIQTGIDYAILKEAKLIVTFDADGQHSLNDAENMISEVLNYDYDVILGSRFLGIKPKNMPISRNFFLKLAVVFTNLLTFTKLTDAHNGLRVLTNDVARNIYLKQNRMAHASEIISQLKKYKIKEMPIKIKYTNYSMSKGQKLSNSVNILKDLLLGVFK